MFRFIEENGDGLPKIEVVPPVILKCPECEKPIPISHDGRISPCCEHCFADLSRFRRVR